MGSFLLFEYVFSSINYARSTKPERRHEVHTYIFLDPPSVLTLTDLTLAFHILLDLLWEWLTALPKWAAFSHIEHFATVTPPLTLIIKIYNYFGLDFITIGKNPCKIHNGYILPNKNTICKTFYNLLYCGKMKKIGVQSEVLDYLCELKNRIVM